MDTLTHRKEMPGEKEMREGVQLFLEKKAGNKRARGH